MRIAIVSLDTRGGVQPYLALAGGLVAAGHEVRTIVPGNYAPLLAGLGVIHVPLSGDVEAEARRLGDRAHGSPIGGMRLAAREVRAWTAIHTREVLEGIEGTDLVLGGVGGMSVALSPAEKAGIPFMEAHLQPVGAPTGRYPGALFGSTPRVLGSLGRRLSHHVTDLAITLPFRAAAREARREVLGLADAPRAHLRNPVLYGFSRHVVPLPASGSRRRHVTGWWWLATPEDWALPADLEAFLADATRPVVSIGFGSMAGENPAELTGIVTGAVRDAGVRAVLLSGWGDLGVGASGDVYVTPALPHDRLFPRVAGVVHHGGAGTTGAGLRAGVPSLVVPFGADQPFWAGRVHALGVGPDPLPRRRLRRASLSAGLQQLVDDEAMRRRAAELGERIRAEDGIGTAVAVIDRFLAST